jgi:4'-phosphopantetheinyl transferase
MLDRLDAFAGRQQALDGAVDVWLLDPARLAAPQALAACLDEAERQRLQGLRRAPDRALYLAAHVFLRHVLSLYGGGVRPAQWTFATGPHGRPEVTNTGWPARRLRFSLSHTHALVAVAVASDWDVGVDVEAARAGLDVAAIAPAALAPEERRWLAGLDPRAREAAFLSLWTVKESLLKAHGVGIAEELGRIALQQGPDRPRAVLTCSPRLASPGPWTVVMGQVASGHALALAAGGRLAVSGPGAAPQRRLVLFDARDPAIALQESVLAGACALPVLEATAAAEVRAGAMDAGTSRGKYTQEGEFENV